MAQQQFFSVVWADVSVPLRVKLGFQPGRVELIDANSVATPTNTRGFEAYWQTGMVDGSAFITKYNAAFLPLTTYTATGGISLFNPLGAAQAQFGATISSFTNANPGVIVVDNAVAAVITAGCIIRVAGVADDQTGPSLNGVYYVASVTGNSITLGTYTGAIPVPGLGPVVPLSPNTSADGVYISGGFVTVLQTAQATIPNPPFNIFSNVPTWYNEAFYGFTIGLNAMAGAVNGDVILVSAFDLMSP